VGEGERVMKMYVNEIDEVEEPTRSQRENQVTEANSLYHPARKRMEVKRGLHALCVDVTCLGLMMLCVHRIDVNFGFNA